MELPLRFQVQPDATDTRAVERLEGVVGRPRSDDGDPASPVTQPFEAREEAAVVRAVDARLHQHGPVYAERRLEPRRSSIEEHGGV